MFDTIIIGAGVTGSSVARELSAYGGSILVVERGEDVCTGTSKANSAIVHAGFDARHGSIMARLNVEGSRIMPSLCQALDVPYLKNGSLVLCFDREDIPRLEALYENGVKNGVEGLCILNQEAVRSLEQNVSPAVIAALYAPTGAIVCPFTLTIALAENAAANGAKFAFDTEVQSLSKTAAGSWCVRTNRGDYFCRAIVNAAGLHADKIHNMVSKEKLHIQPRRGEYLLLDHGAGALVSHTVFQLPGSRGKGVLVTPTVHGNLLLGPTAEDVADFGAVNTTAAGLTMVKERAVRSVPCLPLRQVITSFAGLRAHTVEHDFILGECADAPYFFDCAGIESPGLSAAPAIGRWTAEAVAARLNLTKKEDFIATRQGILSPKALSDEAYNALVQTDPGYGRIVCRCEGITEGEIREAIRRGARSLDGVKRRVRAGMGRCQGGFCSPRVMELLEEQGVPATKCGGASQLCIGKKKAFDLSECGEEA